MSEETERSRRIKMPSITYNSLILKAPSLYESAEGWQELGSEKIIKTKAKNE
jgi:hypothetical protein